jgi:hypothetical protein
MPAEMTGLDGVCFLLNHTLKILNRITWALPYIHYTTFDNIYAVMEACILCLYSETNTSYIKRMRNVIRVIVILKKDISKHHRSELIIRHFTDIETNMFKAIDIYKKATDTRELHLEGLIKNSSARNHKI